MIDYTKTQFIGNDSADQIFLYGSANTGIGVVVDLPAGSLTSGSEYSTTVDNPTDIEGTVNLSYSLDGINYVPATTVQYYYNATFAQYMIDISCYAICTAANLKVYYYTENPAAKTVYANVAVGILAT